MPGPAAWLSARAMRSEHRFTTKGGCNASALPLQQPQFAGAGDRPRPPVHAQFRIGVADVGSHRVDADRQHVGDLLVAVVLGEQAQHGLLLVR